MNANKPKTVMELTQNGYLMSWAPARYNADLINGLRRSTSHVL